MLVVVVVVAVLEVVGGICEVVLSVACTPLPFPLHSCCCLICPGSRDLVIVLHLAFLPYSFRCLIDQLAVPWYMFSLYVSFRFLIHQLAVL